MTKADRTRIATSFIGHFAINPAVRKASVKIFAKPSKNLHKQTAALVNRHVKPAVPLTEADMPALNAEIKKQLDTMPRSIKKLDGGDDGNGGGTADFHNGGGSAGAVLLGLGKFRKLPVARR